MYNKINKYRSCLFCGTDLKGNRNNKYCDIDCRRNHRILIKSEAQELGECENCGKEFIKTFRTKRFCNPKCNIDKRYRDSRILFFDRDGFRCIYCGLSSIEDGVKLHIDHIIPISLKGNNHIDNVVTSCKKCNLEKSNKMLSKDVIDRIIDVVKNRNIKMSKFSTEKINIALEYYNHRGK